MTTMSKLRPLFNRKVNRTRFYVWVDDLEETRNGKRVRLFRDDNVCVINKSSCRIKHKAGDCSIQIEVDDPVVASFIIDKLNIGGSSHVE